MKQKDKSTNTRIKILNAALEEFGTNSYEKSSINRICENGHIAKGVMYHYFKNKDELYLYCVEYCYNLVTKCYEEFLKECVDWKSGVEDYFRIRYSFFIKNPQVMKVFFYTVLNEPKHLSEQFKKIKYNFEKIRYSFFERILEKINLRKGLTTKEVISIIEMIENMLNQNFKINEKTSEDMEKLILKYEETSKKYADILFYGVVDKN